MPAQVRSKAAPSVSKFGDHQHDIERCRKTITKAGKAELILLRFVASYFHGPTKQKEYARITTEQLINREEGKKHKK